jgi:hypothetical protein
VDRDSKEGEGVDHKDVKSKIIGVLNGIEIGEIIKCEMMERGGETLKLM